MTLNPFICIKFVVNDKIDMRYEIITAELTPPTIVSLIPLKREKLGFDPQNKNDISTASQ